MTDLRSSMYRPIENLVGKPLSSIKPDMLFLILVVATTLSLAILSDVFDNDYTVSFVLKSAAESIAWTSMILLVIFLYMHLPVFKKVESRTWDWKMLIPTIIFFAILSFTGAVAGYDYLTGFFKFAFVPVMIAGLYGGCRVSIPATAFMILAHFFLLNLPLDYSEEPYVLVIVGGILGGLIGDFRPNSNLKFLVPLAVMAAHLLCSPGEIGNTQGPVTDFLLFSYYTSAVFMLIGGTYALVLLDLFIKVLKVRENMDRSKKDLMLAHDIQMAAVPVEFPSTHSIDIYATMHPAIEVGGDFYECFTIGRNITVFVVADVSDKGLPASMLMMKMMGTVKAAAFLKPVPGEILTAINKDLCRNNPSDQFLTAWIGIYDSDTGILQYANAGHTPPYIRRGNGVFEKLETKKGLIVGVNEGVRYKNSEIALGDGDAVFIYTDGVNEAFNVRGEQFGHERLSKALNSSGPSDAKGIVDTVEASVKTFIDGNTASDDITTMCFVVNRSGYHSVTVPGKVEQLDNVNAFIEDVLSEAGCPMKEVMKTEIVAEEIFVNICDHAYEEMEGDVTVYCSYNHDEIKLTFADDAKFFNPINKDDVEIDEDVGNWPIGGFGIHMVKKLVTYMDYKYFAGKNIFTIWKRVGAAPVEDEDQ